MNTFAWIGYYADKEFTLKIISQILKKQIDDTQIDNFILNLGPLDLLHLPRVHSVAGSVTNGHIILAPLLLKHIASLDKEVVLEKILSSIRVAIDKNANIICLAGILGEFLPLIKEKIKTKVILITGRKFLTATIINNISEVLRIMEMNPQKQKIAILDITSPVARTCAQILHEKFGEIWIFDKKNRKSSNFTELQNISSTKVKIANSLKDVLKESKFIINTLLLIPDEAISYLESGSVLFDAIVPYWGSKAVFRRRQDVLSLETAWVTRGPLTQKELDFVFPKDAIFCCIAEATMLALEKDIGDSLTRLNPENVAIMKKIGEKHEFFLPALRCGQRIFKNDTILL